MQKRRPIKRRLIFETLEHRSLMAVDVTSNLVGNWSFNEGTGTTTADLAGGDDPGTLIGSPIWTASGKVHGAITLNGTTAYVSVPDSVAQHVTGSNLTVAAWIKTTANNGTVISKGSLTGDHFALQVSGGKARFQFNPGGGPFGVTGTTNVKDGNWHLLVGVRTSNQSCAIYVDGVLDGTLNSTGSFTSIDVTSPLLIGTAGAGTYFNGSIDNARYYTRDLRSADVAALFVSASHPVSVADSYLLPSQSNSISASSGVLANDLPRDQTPLTATLLTNATHGNVILNTDGSFTYVPQLNYVGPDSFTYQVSDGIADPIGTTVSLTVYSEAEWSTIATRIANSVMAGASSITATTVNSTIALMNPDGSFSDLSYVANTTVGANAINTHNSRLTTLAKAYSVVGGPKYNDATVLQKIIDGYTYLANTAPNSLSFPNWYDTKISVPEGLWQGLVVMRSQLSSTLITSLVTKYFDLATAWDLTDLSNKMGGANLVDRASSAIAFAVLKNDPALLTEVTAMIANDLNYAGLQVAGRLPDNGFAQHSVSPLGGTFHGGYQSGEAVGVLAGSYGMVYADELSYMLPWLHGTIFAFSSAAETAFVEWMLDGQAWLFSDKRIEPTVTGRAISGKGATLNRASAMGGYATRIQSLGIRTTELQNLTNRMNNGTTATNLLSGNKSFFATDMMVQQRQGYMASVRMHSQRTLRPETLQIPGGSAPDGAKNFFMADGVTTLYQDGTEYGTISGQDIFPTWNWTRLPGTTLEQLTDAQVISLSTTNASNLTANVGTGAFVGSVSNGTNGAAAMDYGRTLGSVTAKKGYFYFDEGYVALGAGINAPTATNPVNTTLNQTLQNGTVTVKALDGSLQSFGTGGTQTLTNPKWILHGGVGYALLGNNGTVTMQAQSQTGTWESLGNATGTVTQNVFSAWVDHGVAPTNAGYAYAVLPGMNATTLDSYLATSPLSVLSNTASLQAVRSNSAGLTQIAFYQPGSITVASGLTISVDKACMVQVKELAGKNLELSVSDPTQSQAQVKVNVTRRLSGSNVVWQRLTGNSEITINLPSGINNLNAGQSVVSNLNFVDGPQAQLFYNRSTSTVFGNGSGNPINAIDSSKVALRPGQTASFANYSNYLRGINGFVVDGTALATATASDFQFATWNGIGSSGFTTMSTLPTVTVIAGGGTGGLDRLKFEFANNAIRNTWLRITMLANANTNLATNEVFYFGNAVGDMSVGNFGSPTTIETSEADVTTVRQHQSTNANSVSVTNVYDVNKDGRVNSIDTSIVRQNFQSSILRLISAPLSLRLAAAPTSVYLAYPNVSNFAVAKSTSIAIQETKPILVKSDEAKFADAVLAFFATANSSRKDPKSGLNVLEMTSPLLFERPQNKLSLHPDAVLDRAFALLSEAESNFEG